MINKEIEKIVTESLPQVVGEQLKNELARLYSLESQSEYDKNELARVKKELTELKAYKEQKEQQSQFLKESHNKLIQEQKALELAQNGLNCSLLQSKLESANQSKSDIFRLVETIFKAPATKRTVFENESTNTPGTQANNFVPTQTSVVTNLTETIEGI